MRARRPPAAADGAAAALYRASTAAYVGLIAVVVAWEGWLAPARDVPPGFWLSVKSLPLLIPLPGLLRAQPRAFVWAEIIVLPYFAEGTIIAWAERHGPVRADEPLLYAWIEIALAVAFIVVSAFYVRRRGGRSAVAR